ncbi:MAG TPA: RNA polymerase sigma factor [Chryseolinea sp.]|nr:RNA polymerase sigma factor [Chryseolinea sp.]HPH45426.1 RNA polymerase sigma factor [Chryseolinea sp.]HPM28751.1 RNA polymerase sigma factor [Chryseolinea sp.]
MAQHLEKEFTERIDQNRGIIYKVIRLYIHHEDDEKDLFQEILFQAWRSYPRFLGQSKFSTWLYRVALNTVLTFKRRAKLIEPHEDMSRFNAISTLGNRNEESDALYVAIRMLTEIDRMIVTLHLDGYENEEIAEIIGITKNNTAVKLHRIKETLTKKLNAI